VAEGQSSNSRSWSITRAGVIERAGRADRSFYAQAMRLLSDEGLRWRSLLVLLLAFVPLAALLGWLVPGYWWWLGSAIYFAAFVLAVHVMAKRDRRGARRGLR
jgi:Flp pilus assembly protein TadB